MTLDSPRELEHDVEKLAEESPDDTTDSDIQVAWRDADPDARPEGVEWDEGSDVIRFDLWDAQRETLDDLETGEHDITAFLSGYGSGKSVFGARWLLAKALEFPGSRFLAMGVDFTKARDATFRVLFEQLPGDRTGIVTSSFTGPEQSPIVENFDRQHNRLTFVNDTVIKLGSADKWSRHAGDEYGAVWLDEPSHYGEDLHDLLEMIGGRLRGVDGPKTQLWTLTGNGYNSAWEILEQREDPNGDPINLDIEIVRASTLDNPYLADADKERFERQYGDTEREEQALHGGFSAATGLVYSSFSRDAHVIPHEEVEERVSDDWRIYGYDAGWNDPRVLLEIGRTDYGQLVVLDEFHASESHVSDAIQWLDAHDKPKGPIYAEHEPADIEKFNQAGFEAKKAQKSVDPGIDEVRRRLSRDESDHAGLLVSDRARHTIREFLGYKKDEVGTSQAVDHCLDALRYAVFTNEQQGGGAATATARVDGRGSGGGSFPSGQGVSIPDVAKRQSERLRRTQRGWNN